MNTNPLTAEAVRTQLQHVPKFGPRSLSYWTCGPCFALTLFQRHFNDLGSWIAFIRGLSFKINFNYLHTWHESLKPLNQRHLVEATSQPPPSTGGAGGLVWKQQSMPPNLTYNHEFKHSTQRKVKSEEDRRINGHHGTLIY